MNEAKSTLSSHVTLEQNTRAPQPRSSPRTARMRWRAALLAWGIDAAMVIAFAAIGRRSHAHSETLSGVLLTAWPFLAAMCFSWLILRVSARPFALVRAGIPVWLGTVSIGMLLRWLIGGGIALSFIAVAAAVLAVMLIGWRGIAKLLSVLRNTAAP